MHSETVWRVTTPTGETCHFGCAALARAWAGKSGRVEPVTLKRRTLLNAAPKPKTKLSFGDRVRMHREGEGWSVRDAAKDIGTSPATLSRVENGKTPDVFTLAKLCRWMGFSAEQALVDLEA